MSEKKKDLQDIWPELEKNQSFVFGYLKGAVGNSEIARDLCQDVFLSALQNAEKLETGRSLKNWLITVARNRLINFYRESRIRQHESFDEENVAGHRQSLRDERMEKALGRMPGRQRDVFILKEWHGLGHAQLAAETGLSESAVNSLLARARKQFTRNYLLEYLPPGFEQAARQMDLDDLMRFINMFDDTDDILSAAAAKEQNYFSRLRSKWDRIREDFFSENHLDQIFAHIGSPAGFCLDLGSAAGFVAFYLQRKAQRVVALDYNDAMLTDLNHVRNTLLLQNLDSIRAHMVHLPFARRSFDTVFCSLVLHHIARPEEVFEESSRALKVGGHLVVIEFDRHHNKALADMMHDLWLGFEPSLTERWAKRHRLQLKEQDAWSTMYNIDVYYQIYEKR